MKLYTTDTTKITWAWVGDSQIDIDNKKTKAILLADLGENCIERFVCVTWGNADNFMKGNRFDPLRYSYAKIITESEYRPLKSFGELLKRIGVDVDCSAITLPILSCKGGDCVEMMWNFSNMTDWNSIFKNAKFVDGSPIGVKIED